MTDVRRAMLILGFAGAASCKSATDADSLPPNCTVTQVENFGCSRFRVSVEAPAGLPSRYLIDIIAVPVDTSAGVYGSYNQPASFSTVTLGILRTGGPARTKPDTITVRIVGKILDLTTAATGEMIPVFAADSTRLVATLAAPGSLAPVQALTLKPRR